MKKKKQRNNSLFSIRSKHLSPILPGSDFSTDSRFEYQINPAKGLLKNLLALRTYPQKLYFQPYLQADHQYQETDYQ